MAAETRDEILQKYVGDMVAVVNHTVEVCERQLDDKDLQAIPDGLDIVRRVVETLRVHRTSLEQRAKDIGAPLSAVKEAVSSVTGAVIGLYDRIRSETVSKMLRDHYAALTMTAMAYEMLHTTALALKDQPTADLSIKHMRDLPPLIMEIGHIVPMVIVRELAEKGIVVDHGVADQAAHAAEEAWRSPRPAS